MIKKAELEPFDDPWHTMLKHFGNAEKTTAWFQKENSYLGYPPRRYVEKFGARKLALMIKGMFETRRGLDV